MSLKIAAEYETLMVFHIMEQTSEFYSTDMNNLPFSGLGKKGPDPQPWSNLPLPVPLLTYVSLK